MYEPDSWEELMNAAYAGNGCTSCLATTHTADNCPSEKQLVVKVTARNDAGEKVIEWGAGDTTEEAVRDALDIIIASTDDDSFVMDDWEAA
jgi:hypothetical protein